MAASNKYVCIHGHFYQPPRENAWLESVERQESAAPFHDWNERINFECYAPNAAARIVDKDNYIIKIRNNYKRISFNFGPTLLSWLKSKDPETARLIQIADELSCKTFGGHGNALAQCYGHLIMPLCNRRDKITQIQWGIADFEDFYKRKPEGMWLPETAVDTETLEILAAHGIRFVILAPSQARRVRRTGEREWSDTTQANLDTRRAYRCALDDGSEIAIFFYDGALSREVAFNGLLNSGKRLAERLLAVFSDDDTPQLSHIATDGETYGHHHRFGEMALADALNSIEERGEAQITNYGQYLQLHPPEYEVEIHENSSWSCAHGVERWRADCGCNTGAHPGWNQAWRKPLRETLDWLRDTMIPLYEREGARLFHDPWTARNRYIAVLLNRDAFPAFLKKNARRALAPEEETQALRLLELQRQAMQMYTSCGWFFDDLSGIETNQILQYALRVLDYAQDMFGIGLHKEFIYRLSLAQGNLMDGATSFQQLVEPTRISMRRVAEHFAVAALFEEHPEQMELFNFSAEVAHMDCFRAGHLRLALGMLTLHSKISHAQLPYAFAALYLGQQHVIAKVCEQMPRVTYDEMYPALQTKFAVGHVGEILRLMQRYFGDQYSGLDALFADEKQRVIAMLTRQNLEVADAAIADVFNDNYQLLHSLELEGLGTPDKWRNIAAYALRTELLQWMWQDKKQPVRTLRRIAADIRLWRLQLSDEKYLSQLTAERILREIRALGAPQTALADVQWLADTLLAIRELPLKPDYWKSQNAFYLHTKGLRKGWWVYASPEWQAAYESIAESLKVRLYVGNA